MTNELSLTTADCIHKTTNIGETVITNICTGNVVFVPWGNFDILVTCVLGVLSVAMITLFLFLAIEIGKDVFSRY